MSTCFQHPKLCQRFAKNGDRRDGCKKGENCREFHPMTCWDSLERKECSRVKCRFFHLNGTKHTYDSDFSRNDWNPNDGRRNRPENPRQENTNGPRNQTHAPVWSRRQNDENRNSVENRSFRYEVESPHDMRQTGQNQDFLQMDQRMQRLETMLTALLQSFRPPAPGVRSQDH